MRLAPRLYIQAPGPFLALLLTVLSVTVPSVELINPRTTLMCHVRHYQFRIHKPDVLDPDTGAVLRCSGVVTVNSCWGRCDSSEVRPTIILDTMSFLLLSMLVLLLLLLLLLLSFCCCSCYCCHLAYCPFLSL